MQDERVSLRKTYVLKCASLPSACQAPDSRRKGLLLRSVASQERERERKKNTICALSLLSQTKNVKMPTNASAAKRITPGQLFKTRFLALTIIITNFEYKIFCF
jgi:hypothetical protein